MKRLLAAVLCAACSTAAGCAGTLQRQPPRTDDPGIESLTARRLAADSRLCPYDITVVVSNRTARLDGKVSSPADRRQAVELAFSAGALQVDDQLTIDPAAGDLRQC
jgi:osmotically-inducible protein OsmY